MGGLTHACQAGDVDDIGLFLKALGGIEKKCHLAFCRSLALLWANILGDKLGDVAAVQARDRGDPVRVANHRTETRGWSQVQWELELCWRSPVGGLWYRISVPATLE